MAKEKALGEVAQLKSQKEPVNFSSVHELSGKIATMGSDSHTPNTLCFDFDKTKDILLSCGFRYYTVFEKRMPEFMKLTP